MEQLEAVGKIDALNDVRPTAGRRLYGRQVAGFLFAETVYRPNARTDWHRHELPSLEIVLDGGYVKRRRQSDDECGPGTLTVEPAGDNHAGIYGPAGWHALLIEVTPSELAGARALAQPLSRPLCRREGRVRLIARRAAAELRAADSVSALVLESIALELIAIAARRSPPHRARPAWMQLVTEQLRSEFRSEIRLTALAAGAGVHPAHLARTFRTHEGCTVGDFVRRLRVEWAADQLTTTAKSISFIAQAAGFFDQSHFACAFKHRMGLTPAQYRAAAAGVQR